MKWDDKNFQLVWNTLEKEEGSWLFVKDIYSMINQKIRCNGINKILKNIKARNGTNSSVLESKRATGNKRGYMWRLAKKKKKNNKLFKIRFKY